MAHPQDPRASRPGARPIQLETQGLDVIGDAERKGTPRTLFWPWFGANVSVLGIGYGAFALGFAISFWQALAAGVLGILASFLLCGFIAVAGKRGSAPTMVLSRAAYGVRGNRLPSVISWMLTVGWETVLIALATLATATVFGRLGWGGGTETKVVALLVVAALTVVGGVMGFDLIMRLQTAITVITGVLTFVYVGLVADHVHWETVRAVPAYSAARARRMVDFPIPAGPWSSTLPPRPSCSRADVNSSSRPMTRSGRLLAGSLKSRRTVTAPLRVSCPGQY